MRLGRKAVGETLFSFLGMGTGRKERQRVVFYRAGGNTGEFELENGKEKANHVSLSLASMASGFLDRLPRMLVGEPKRWGKEGRLWKRVCLVSFPFNAMPVESLIIRDYLGFGRSLWLF